MLPHLATVAVKPLQTDVGTGQHIEYDYAPLAWCVLENGTQKMWQAVHHLNGATQSVKKQTKASEADMVISMASLHSPMVQWHTLLPHQHKTIERQPLQSEYHAHCRLHGAQVGSPACEAAAQHGHCSPRNCTIGAQCRYRIPSKAGYEEYEEVGVDYTGKEAEDEKEYGIEEDDEEVGVEWSCKAHLQLHL